jgi:hypothetical protein
MINAASSTIPATATTLLTIDSIILFAFFVVGIHFAVPLQPTPHNMEDG